MLLQMSGCPSFWLLSLKEGHFFFFFNVVVVNTVVYSNIPSSGRKADVLLGREGHLSLNFVYNGQGRVVIKAG